MKPSAWLINFARGAVIVDDDLIAAVKAKTIAGAVLDVFRTEPLPLSGALKPLKRELRAPYWEGRGRAV